MIIINVTKYILSPSPKGNKSISPLGGTATDVYSPWIRPRLGLDEVFNYPNTYNPQWGWMGKKDYYYKLPICEKGEQK